MKGLLIILFFFTAINYGFNAGRTMPSAKTYHYLALGDSYTIGESVPAADNFPHQAVRLLAGDSLIFQSPRIIAKTGWTTDELEAGIQTAYADEPLQSDYDLVSLLIGVNNQYRGRSRDEYRQQFEQLLKKAIGYAGNRAERVVVLSIPDWGVTPFAEGRDRRQIENDIDAFNAINRQIAARYDVHYIDITPWTREAAQDVSLLAADGLHPSGKEYKRWAERIAAFFKSRIRE